MWLRANGLLRSGFPNYLWARIKAANDIQTFAKHGETNIAYVTKERDEGCEQKVAE